MLSIYEHNDVMLWKRFPHYWPFFNVMVRMDSRCKGCCNTVLLFLLLLEQAFEQTTDLTVVWDAMTFMQWVFRIMPDEWV